eukprot:TRINITY_DN188_c0_g1_i3.p4 TRINITY_DN188_c0_g1~~TRINITY_DN188_c0_g1_i3.p4  ORF type:complete len:105 (+),score=11.70 TRINITY_DN188_c0_g1_i3:95-409(+)
MSTRMPLHKMKGKTSSRMLLRKMKGEMIALMSHPPTIKHWKCRVYSRQAKRDQAQEMSGVQQTGKRDQAQEMSGVQQTGERDHNQQDREVDEDYVDVLDDVLEL